MAHKDYSQLWYLLPTAHYDEEQAQEYRDKDLLCPGYLGHHKEKVKNIK